MKLCFNHSGPRLRDKPPDIMTIEFYTQEEVDSVGQEGYRPANL